MNNSRKSVLITGGTGYIGSRLIRHLVSLDYKVCVVSRNLSSAEAFQGLQDSITVKVYDGSYRSLSTIFQEFRPDYVLHLASFYIPEHSAADLDDLIESNLRFSTFLLEAAAMSSTKYVIAAGSSWQCSQGGSDCSVNLYAATKNAFDSILRYYTEAYSFKSITLLLYDTYGPSDPRNKIVSNLVKAAKSGCILELSPGGQQIDLVHVDDVVEAFVCSMEFIANSSHRNSIFGVFSGKPISIRELVELCRCCFRVPLKVEFGSKGYRSREVMVPSYYYPVLPSWAPRIDLSAGIKPLVTFGDGG